MSDKDKEVARCKVRDASKEIKYQEGYRLQDARYKNSLPVGQSTGLPVKIKIKTKSKTNNIYNNLGYSF